MAQHEFTPEQNRTFDSMVKALWGFAGSVGTLSVLMIVYAFIGLNTAHFGSAVMILIMVSSLVALVLAWQFTRPIDNLRAITTQSGRDMSELATALDDLCGAHSTFLILVAIWVFVCIAGLVMVRG